MVVEVVQILRGFIFLHDEYAVIRSLFVKGSLKRGKLDQNQLTSFLSAYLLFSVSMSFLSATKIYNGHVKLALTDRFIHVNRK
jgi:hypothetical protein